MFRLLHMPTGLICYQFVDEKKALNALKFFEDRLKDRCTLELYSIENMGLVCVHQESAFAESCERKVHTIREFTIIEDESKCLE